MAVFGPAAFSPSLRPGANVAPRRFGANVPPAAPARGSGWTAAADPDMVRPMREPAAGKGVAVRPPSGSGSGRRHVLAGVGVIGLGMTGLGVIGYGVIGYGAAVADGGTVTVTGVRVSRGDAVECPRLRDDAGVLHPVSYLPPRVALGDRVTVSGTLAVTTTCRGIVLVVEKLVEGAPESGGASGGE
jgi:hypothetical protein